MSVFAQDELRLLTSVDGEPVALHDFGGVSGGAPLLLTHGNGLNAGMWAGAVPRLTRSFRVYGLDLRGHGRARPTTADYGVTRHHFVGDLVTAVEAIGGPVCLAGHSLGAATAIWAAREHAEPERLFTGLWLFEPVAIPAGIEFGGEGARLLIDLARRRRMDFESIEDAVGRFLAKPPFSTSTPEAVEGYVELGTIATQTGVRLSCRGEDEARVFDTPGTMDFAELAQIEIPTLVVSGAAADTANALPPRLAPLVADALANARWVELDGLSHFGPMEAPEMIADSIVEFFADHQLVQSQPR